MKLSKEQAEKLLEKNGLNMYTLTGTENGKFVENTAFVDYFGITLEYNKEAVYAWLGY